jgi:O-antigen/teichoic acid export membrane protein
MISKNLLKSSFIYTFIGALPLASAFFLLPFYTNYLSKNDYGLLALYISFTTFVQIIINFGLDTYIGITYFDNKDQKDKLRTQIGAIAAYLLILGIIFTILISVFGNSFFTLIFETDEMHFYPFGLMSVVTAFFNSYFKTYTNLLINQKRPERFFWLNSANFVMTIGFSLSGILMYPFSLNGPIWGRFLSGVGIFIISLYCFQKEFGLRLEFGNTLRKALSFSLPVVIFFVLQWIVGNNYPYLLDHLMTPEDIALFDFAVKCTLLVEFALNGLSSTIMPYVFELIKDKDLRSSTPELNKYFSSFTALSLIGIPFFILIIPLVLPLFQIQADYFEAFIFIAVLGIGFVSRGLYNYFLAPIYFYKHTRVLPKVYLITAIVQITLSIVFIKMWGLWGLTWSMLISKVLQNAFLFLEAKRFFKFSFNTTKLIWLPLVNIIMICACEAFFSYETLHWKHTLQFFLSFITVFAIYRNEINSFGQFLFKKLRYRKVS